MSKAKVKIEKSDALIIVDVQNDFLPGGALEVPGGNIVIPVLNKYIDLFCRADRPVIATRDWHPPDHCSFVDSGGQWPPHCIRETPGAEFSPNLKLPDNTIIISKATSQGKDAYSGFEGTNLNEILKKNKIRRVFVGGLATDYCVLNTVIDALKYGYTTLLLVDAIRAVNVNPDDGEKAVEKMIENGALAIRLEDIITPNTHG